MGFEHVIPEIVKKVYIKTKKLSLKECVIKIQGSGFESRSFCYIDDAVNGIILAANKGKNKQIYNVGNQDEIMIKDLIYKISVLMNVNVKIQTGKLQKGSALRRAPDMRKLKLLGFKSINNLNIGLLKTINWYKDFYQSNV